MMNLAGTMTGQSTAFLPSAGSPVDAVRAFLAPYIEKLPSFLIWYTEKNGVLFQIIFRLFFSIFLMLCVKLLIMVGTGRASDGLHWLPPAAMAVYLLFEVYPFYITFFTEKTYEVPFWRSGSILAIGLAVLLLALEIAQLVLAYGKNGSNTKGALFAVALWAWALVFSFFVEFVYSFFVFCHL